jgi:hypothetical protein
MGPVATMGPVAAMVVARIKIGVETPTRTPSVEYGSLTLDSTFRLGR